MSVYSTAGAKLYIGPALQLGRAVHELTESSFSSITWTEIYGLEGLGSAGDTSEVSSTGLVNIGRVVKAKGMRDGGTMEVVMGSVPDDAGQIALIAAEKTKWNFPFKLVFDDAPPGGTPSERKFAALVMSAVEQFNQGNDTIKLNSTLAINSNVVRKNAAAGGGA